MFKQEINIPMGIDPLSYWENRFLYFFESKHVQQIISKEFPRALNFHGISRFIENFCTINDNGDIFLHTMKSSPSN